MESAETTVVATSDARSPSSTWEATIRRRHLPALDGLRAVAVFIVILGHLNAIFLPADLGVTIFFVLSGFLITLLLLREWDATGNVSLKRFYARRALRIFPAYFTYLAFTFSLDTVLGDLRWKHLLLPALTYTVNYYNALHGHPSTSVAHAWSLSIEEQFYLVWPGVFLLVAPRGLKSLCTFLIGAIAAVLLIRCTLWYGVHVNTAYVYNAFETRFDNLAIGCLLAVVAQTGFMLRTVDLLARRTWYPALTIMAVAFSRPMLGDAFHYGPGFTFEALLIAVLVMQLLVLSRRLPWQWLESRLTTYLGRISYSLYLYHGWGNALGGKLVRSHGPAQLVVQLAACVLLASGSYHLIERPFLRLKDRSFRAAD
jgi:peptidoglycan/LPS O-acetylase OafA/YrhL